ncbi:MAG: ADP-ribosylglycohydrolase family protein [Planctomycetota bacterium]
MAPIVLDARTFRDKVFACWLGKNIGGTLGLPYECLRHTHALTYFDPVPKEPAPNDDLDLQLIWLTLLEEKGLDPPLPHFADYWARYASAYPWNEYGCFMRNYERGLRPPVAGCFENYFVDEMGAPIRSEIWACLHPADPHAAARMAWKDSSLDHAGGEGMFGEMFWAACQSAAFVESDPLTLIRIGLNMIPLSSHVARAIREVLWCRASGKTWGVARERIATIFGHSQPCNAVPNHAFTIIGWLYGADFGDRLCKAVNCGYDTDCTGATLGATLGIIGGTRAIPRRWSDPVGKRIVLHKFTGDLPAPRDLRELTSRTVALARKAARDKTAVAFGKTTRLPSDVLSRLFANDLASAALSQDIHSASALAGSCEVILHYGGEPVIYPGIPKKLRVSLPSCDGPRVDLIAPKGFKVARLGDAEFLLAPPRRVPPRSVLRVVLDGGSAAHFTILGPDEAQGFPAAENVPTCPRCRARLPACVCKKLARKPR